jgi:hypothetical protein
MHRHRHRHRRISHVEHKIYARLLHTVHTTNSRWSTTWDSFKGAVAKSCFEIK